MTPYVGREIHPMTAPCKPWWRNCALEADPEILEIDAMEDRIGPIGTNLSGVRELISSLELCHHKAERWVYSAIEAIGAGESHKGLGTRPPGQHHPAETVWENACAMPDLGREVDERDNDAHRAEELADGAQRRPVHGV